MIEDVVNNTYQNIQKNNIKNIDEIQNFSKMIVDFSDFMKNINQQIKVFLTNKMYRHDLVNQMSQDAHITINKIFDHIFLNPKKFIFSKTSIFFSVLLSKFI